MQSQFSERFRQLVEEFSGTTKDLAKFLNVSQQTISAWQLGVRSPKLPIIEHIARYFNVSIPWLCGLDVERGSFYEPQLISFDGLPARETITDEERLLVKSYREAKPEYRSVVLDILVNHKQE